MARILIAEDEPDIQEMMTFLLRRAGHEVLNALDGEEAYRRALAELPDIILMDVRMPRLDGYEACRLIKAEPKLQHIPVIFISVRNEQTERKVTAELGGADYVSKPFSPEALTRRINEILAQQAASV
jgi:CheY-like chemotaxis protein